MSPNVFFFTIIEDYLSEAVQFFFYFSNFSNTRHKSHKPLTQEFIPLYFEQSVLLLSESGLDSQQKKQKKRKERKNDKKKNQIIMFLYQLYPNYKCNKCRTPKVQYYLYSKISNSVFSTLRW